MDVLPVPDDGKNDDEVVALVSLSNGALRFFDPEELTDLELCERIFSGVLKGVNPLNPEEIWEVEGGTRNPMSLTMTTCLVVRLVNELLYLSLTIVINNLFGGPSSSTGTASIISCRTLISLA